MNMAGWKMPSLVSLAMVCLITGVLWCLKLDAVPVKDPIFFYLLPTAFVAVRYGSLPGLLCAVGGTVCAAFFLYEPVYSFYVSNDLEIGELVWFIVLALMGVKCAAELMRPSARLSATKSG